LTRSPHHVVERDGATVNSVILHGNSRKCANDAMCYGRVWEEAGECSLAQSSMFASCRNCCCSLQRHHALCWCQLKHPGRSLRQPFVRRLSSTTCQRLDRYPRILDHSRRLPTACGSAV